MKNKIQNIIFPEFVINQEFWIDDLLNKGWLKTSRPFSFSITISNKFPLKIKVYKKYSTDFKLNIPIINKLINWKESNQSMIYYLIIEILYIQGYLSEIETKYVTSYLINKLKLSKFKRVLCFILLNYYSKSIYKNDDLKSNTKFFSNTGLVTIED